MKQYCLLLPFLLSLSSVFGQEAEIFSKSGGAIQGYDAVAYFKDQKPVKGNEKFTFRWKDATWYFVSAENLQIFKSNPEKYSPQYGGYCAYGMAGGYKAPTSPDAWTIVDGKLYLNYDVSVRGLWNKDQKSFIKRADENWPTVKSKKE